MRFRTVKGSTPGGLQLAFGKFSRAHLNTQN